MNQQVKLWQVLKVGAAHFWAQIAGGDVVGRRKE